MPHRPLDVSQVTPAAQSAFEAHSVLQWSPSALQPSSPGHAVAAVVWQSAVVPLHVPATVSVALVHAVTPHVVPLVAIAQAPALHCEHAPTGQLPCGSRTPSETGVHVPTEPEIEHEVHAPVHAVAQQTPSARKPLLHCDAEVAGAPLATVAGLGRQTPGLTVVSQWPPPTQSVSAVQLVLQPPSVQP
jgi:hypothetical protein